MADIFSIHCPRCDNGILAVKLTSFSQAEPRTYYNPGSPAEAEWEPSQDCDGCGWDGVADLTDDEVSYITSVIDDDLSAYDEDREDG